MNNKDLQALRYRYERNEGAYLTVERLNGTTVERTQGHKDVGELLAMLNKIASLVPRTRPFNWTDSSGESRSVESCGICGCSGSCSAGCPSGALDCMRASES